MGIKCFWVEPTNQLTRSLRRYCIDSKCTGPLGYHNTEVRIENTIKENDDKYNHIGDFWPHDDPRWPKTCECGYVYQDSDEWQLFVQTIYIRPDTGELFDCGDRKLPPGAMYDAFWMPNEWKGADGRSIVVVLPDGRQWMIDSQASNCTKPNDDNHKCWVRHGEPPNITVDKNGLTCDAGGGSIMTRDYHGHLINGEFIAC